jgi:hypothetical protein
MNVARSSSAALFLSGVVAFFALAPSAHADGARHTDRLLQLAAGDAENLPTSLNLWSAVESSDLKDAHPRSMGDFFPQGRISQKTPFIDFSRFEMGGYAGIVAFSSDFEADPNGVAGITARVPVPGLPLGDWGIFAQLFVSYVSRDLPFYYDDKAGAWIGAEVGGDYTFLKDEIWYLRGQVGILYANWMGVNALDDGIGLLVGMQAGFYWIKHNPNAVVTITPQLSFDGDNWLGFFTVGFSYDF